MAGPLSVGLRARLEQAHLLLVRAEAGFLGGQPHCVCGYGLRHTGRLRRGHRNDSGLARTKGTVFPGRETGVPVKER